MNKIKQLQTQFLNIDLCIHDSIWNKHLKLLEPKIIEVTNYVIKKLKINTISSGIELCIILANDKEIRKINCKHRGKDKSTNVLSFPTNEIDLNNLSVLVSKKQLLPLGDIILSYDTITKEHTERNISFHNHFLHLLVHGLLHLLGFDHEITRDAKNMENLEIAILRQFGINSPYII